MKKIKLIAITGPAGSGKDTILKEVVKRNPEWHKIVNYTSRPQRENELNHYNYHFVNRNEFLKMVAADEMLEYNEFNHWFYGTSISDLDKEKINVGVFNPSGIRKIKRTYDDVIDMKVYRIDAYDKERLLRQLNREKMPNIDEIFRRYYADKVDFSYEYLNAFTTIYPLSNHTEEDIKRCVDFICEYATFGQN